VSHLFLPVPMGLREGWVDLGKGKGGKNNGPCAGILSAPGKGGGGGNSRGKGERKGYEGTVCGVFEHEPAPQKRKEKKTGRGGKWGRQPEWCWFERSRNQVVWKERKREHGGPPFIKTISFFECRNKEGGEGSREGKSASSKVQLKLLFLLLRKGGRSAGKEALIVLARERTEGAGNEKEGLFCLFLAYTMRKKAMGERAFSYSLSL